MKHTCCLSVSDLCLVSKNTGAFGSCEHNLLLEMNILLFITQPGSIKEEVDKF